MKIPKPQIPISFKTSPEISAAAQSHLPIADIVDDLILTKEGGAAIILKTSALNFSLLSEKEQEAIIFAYAALLNSLSFPIQILIRSQKKDVSAYLDYLARAETKIKIAKLKSLMAGYRSFVSSVVKKRNVLEKEFLIVIPFSPLELGVSLGGLAGLLPQARRRVPFPREYVLEKAKTILGPRRDHLIRQSGRLGVKVRQLTSAELIELFLRIYKTEEKQNGQP